MIKKAILAIVFVPVHGALTAFCVLRWLNYNAVADTGLWPQVVNLCAKILSLPVLLPLKALDPDGGRFPGWFRAASVPANSLVWALLILAACAGIKANWRDSQSMEVPK